MRRKKRIGIVLWALVLALLFVNACLIRYTIEDTAKSHVEKSITRIIKEANKIKLGEAKNNIIFIVGDIDRQKTIKIIREIKQIKKSKYKEVVIYLDSDGGSAFPGFAICRTILDCRKHKDVKIVCRHAYSMGAEILAVGTKGKRFILTDFWPTVMIHHTGFYDKEDKRIPQNELSEIAIAVLNYIDKLVYNLLVKNTGQTEKTIMEDMDDVTYYSSKWAVEFGFADKIIPYK